MEKKEVTSNLEANTEKIKDSASKFSSEFQKELKTPDGQRNMKIIVTLGLIFSIMAVVYIGLSKNLVNHSSSETKIKAMEYSKIAKDQVNFKANADKVKENSINAIKTSEVK